MEQSVQAFLDRVFQHLPASPPTGFQLSHWKFGGKPTDEAVGIMPVIGADPDAVLNRVMDVDHYVGNIDHVIESRSVPDDRFSGPDSVHFYQKINIPLLRDIQHESLLVRVGEMKGYQVAAWYMLEAETAKLKPKVAARSQFNFGAWIVAPGVVAYAISSAPRREDVNFIQWKALTKGADVAAKNVLQGNIGGMTRWAAQVK